jgi:erythronate-4-phosphate dehydrogenase
MTEKRLKIVADDKIPFLRGVLEPYADMVYLPGAKITRADVKNADALFTRTRTQCNAELLDGSRVRLIATATIGYDHIDTSWCEAAGIHWVNAPGCNSSSVQQYITTVLVMLAKRQGFRLQDTTLGIIGAGNVGRKVAGAASALGMRILLNDPPRADLECPEAFMPLDELLAKSDIVTCHTPLAIDAPYPTYHLASEAFFDRMKTGAVFINSSRGAVVDSVALRRAAESKLSAFVLDVWENEPDIDPCLLRDAFIATPHIAGYSADGKANGTAACIHALCSFFGLEILPEWYPKTIPLSPFSPSFAIDGRDKTVEAVFYEAVTHTYPLEEDSRQLKESPSTFEAQRGKYWTRREFDAYTLQLKQVSSKVAKGLSELGFRMNSGIESN